MEKETLEQKIKEAGGNLSDEIIAKVKQLAAVDVKIKAACDEIENIEQELCDKHNELAEQINKLIHRAVEETGSAEGDSSSEEAHEKPESKRVRIEVHVVKARPVNPALMALMEFLLS